MTKDMSEEKEWKVKCAFLESRLKEAESMIKQYELVLEPSDIDAAKTIKSLEQRLSQAEAELAEANKSLEIWHKKSSTAIKYCPKHEYHVDNCVECVRAEFWRKP